MVWVLAGVAALVVIGIAIVAVNRVTLELGQTVTPALLRIEDAVEAVAEALPFEVAAVLSHQDVETIIRWLLDWFDQLGLASEFGEELGGEWVAAERVVADEIGAADYAVARAVAEQPDFDATHITVIVDEFLAWLRDIGAVGDAVD